MSATKTVTIIGELNKSDLRRINVLLNQFKDEHPRRPDYLVTVADDDDVDQMVSLVGRMRQRGEPSGSAH